MGMSADALLVFGFAVTATDDEGEPTPFWDGTIDDWLDLAELDLSIPNPWLEPPADLSYSEFQDYCRDHPEYDRRLDEWQKARRKVEEQLNIELVHFGHCDDEPHAILTPKRMPKFSGDCWDPTEIDVYALEHGAYDGMISRANDDCRRFGFDLDFYAAKWLLAASFG